MDGFLDASGLNKLADDLARLADAMPETNERIVKEMAARTLRGAIKGTPVGVYPVSSGKKGGTLRRGWTAEPVERTPTGAKASVINPVEYAPYVEFGHRIKNRADGPVYGWQPGRFMLTKTVDKLKTQAERIVNKEVQITINKVLK